MSRPDSAPARSWGRGVAIEGVAIDELAAEFGCARSTVNRALRELAEAGFLERRRKAGTRISPDPVRKATLKIAGQGNVKTTTLRAFDEGEAVRIFESLG